MRQAVIDMGTNTVRLLVADKAGGALQVVDKRADIARLGECSHASGRLQENAMARAIGIVRSHAARARELGAEAVWCYATSAVRDADNGASFAARVREETGVEMEILSGEAEARIGLSGALCGETGRLGMIDIGGGSTEIAFGEKETLRWAHSFPLGAVRLLERFVQHDPPDRLEMDAMTRHIHEVLAPEAEAMRPPADSARLVVVGGTATTLAAMDMQMTHYDARRVHTYGLRREALQAWSDKLCAMTVAERAYVAGLQKGREDVIIAGAAILLGVLDTLAADTVAVRDCDGLEGYLWMKMNG